MAVRALSKALLMVLLAILPAVPATACFGPKLYVGVAADPRQEMLFALVSLYVAEKTGVQSEPVDLKDGELPGPVLLAEKVDLVFAPAPIANSETVLAIPGYPVLLSGSRPLNDLQFTTVLPALRKLGALLAPGDLHELEKRIAAGEKPLAAARRLCMDRHWL